MQQEKTNSHNFWQNSKSNNNLAYFCNTGLLIRILFFFWVITLYLNGVLSSNSLKSKLIPNGHLLIWSVMRLYIFQLWKCLFTWVGTSKYWQQYMSIWLWRYSSFRRKLQNSIRLFSWYLPVSLSLYSKLITFNWRLCINSIAPLNEFWNMKIVFALALKKLKT